jgi:hypothetical protein
MLRCEATRRSGRDRPKNQNRNRSGEFTLNNILQTCAAAFVAASVLAAPAFAERLLTGAEAHALLSGQRFSFFCVDGTRGEASYNKSGVATANYRLPVSPNEGEMLTDHGRVRHQGESVCIRWNTLNGGAEACFRMTERQPGRYRIATDDRIRWCDLTVRGMTERADRN